MDIWRVRTAVAVATAVAAVAAVAPVCAVGAVGAVGSVATSMGIGVLEVGCWVLEPAAA